MSKCYNCMCGARRRAGSARALLLFLVTCMHDAMQAMCMLCAIWRTVTGGTKDLKNAWLNVRKGVWKNWKSWDTWKLGAACIRHGVAANREKNQQRLGRENIGERQKEKRVLSTSLCRQLWLCHRRLGSSWSYRLFYQDLLWDRAKLLGLSSPLFALLHCRERHLVIIGIYGIFGRWDSTGQWD